MYPTRDESGAGDECRDHRKTQSAVGYRIDWHRREDFISRFFPSAWHQGYSKRWQSRTREADWIRIVEFIRRIF